MVRKKFYIKRRFIKCSYHELQPIRKGGLKRGDSRKMYFGIDKKRTLQASGCEHNVNTDKALSTG